MRLMIVGSKGQLGTELIRLLNEGRSVLGAIPDVYDGAELIAVDINELNAADRTATIDAISELRPDIIFNCAAFTRVDDCEGMKDDAIKGNAIAPRNLAEAAELVNAKLIHISTDYVFDGNAKEPYTEADPAIPVTAYGKSKLLGEKYVSDFCSRYFIVRTAWLYGRTGKNFVKTMINLCSERDSIKVVNDQWGCPTNAEDLAHHLLIIAVTEEYGIYHCVGNGTTSWYGFTREIARHIHSQTRVKPCSTRDYPTPAKRPAYSVLSNSMLRLTVGDNMRKWDVALADYMKEYIEQNSKF